MPSTGLSYWKSMSDSPETQKRILLTQPKTYALRAKPGEDGQTGDALVEIWKEVVRHSSGL
jgi:hypothetical protein